MHYLLCDFCTVNIITVIKVLHISPKKAKASRDFTKITSVWFIHNIKVVKAEINRDWTVYIWYLLNSMLNTHSCVFHQLQILVFIWHHKSSHNKKSSVNDNMV